MGLEVIKEVYKKKSEERERPRRKVIEDTFKAIEKLKEEISFEDAYIFGSAAKPYQFGEFSDVDIAFSELDKDKLFEDIHFKDKIIKEGIKWKKG